jgi:hypothetical protein
MREASQAAGRAYVERLKRRVTDRDAPVSMLSAGAQEAIREWGAGPSSDRYVVLSKISHRNPHRAWQQGHRRYPDQRLSA